MAKILLAIILFFSSDISLAEPWLEKASHIETKGKLHLGKPYRYGFKSFSDKAFDCASFTQFLYSEIGVELPRPSGKQALIGVDVPLNDIRKGDLLFFKKTESKKDKRVNHVAIYIGDNMLLHTFSKKSGVTTTKLYGLKWGRTLLYARRVING